MFPIRSLFFKMNGFGYEAPNKGDMFNFKRSLQQNWSKVVSFWHSVRTQIFVLILDTPERSSYQNAIQQHTVAEKELMQWIPEYRW